MLSHFVTTGMFDAPTPAAPTELEQLRLDRAAVYAAKLALLKGERVKEVAREGRRMVMDGANMAQVDAALAEIDRGIAALTAEAAGTRRRHAFRLRFG